jgi:metal-responsive CopG/Arc/MetJ family transcriptional regulator
MAKLERTSFSLPRQMVRDLAYLSQRIGVSRSALLADLSTEPLADLRALVEQIPENPTPADIVRLRGKSEEVVQRRLAQLHELDKGLFPADDAPRLLTGSGS